MAPLLQLFLSEGSRFVSFAMVKQSFFRSEQRQGVDNSNLSGSDLHSEDAMNSEKSSI